MACQGEPYPIAIVCDHDAEDRATLERHLKLETLAAFKSITPGIQAVQRRLKPSGDRRARIFLLRDALVERDQALLDAHLPTCTEEEIEGYAWPTNINVRHGEHPVDRDNHGMDAMRYCVAFHDSLAVEEFGVPLPISLGGRVSISRY